MGFLLSILLRLLLGLIGFLPLRVVAGVGRWIGMLIYIVDRRHRNIAIRNLTACFGDEKSESEIRGMAKENFKRIGENFGCAAKTMLMDKEELPGLLTMSGTEPFRSESSDPRSRIFALGHFGNFELCARCYDLPEGSQFATTYRGIPQKSVERAFQKLRNRTGCLYFERRKDVGKLRTAMQGSGIYLGLLADQHGGDRALRLPFFGRECSVSTAPAVFALRYGCPLHVTICYRVALARWNIEISEEIPTHKDSEPRQVEDITREINAKFEEAIRRDPANWFWVHNRWKPAKPMSKRPKVRPQ